VEKASNMTSVGMHLAPVVTVVMEIEALELRKVHTLQRKIALLQCISVSMTLYSNQQSCYSKIRTVRVASKDLTVQNMVKRILRHITWIKIKGIMLGITQQAA